jgi:hypothetical protein
MNFHQLRDRCLSDLDAEFNLHRPPDHTLRDMVNAAVFADGRPHNKPTKPFHAKLRIIEVEFSEVTQCT